MEETTEVKTPLTNVGQNMSAAFRVRNEGHFAAAGSAEKRARVFWPHSHLDHRAREVYEMSANEQARQPHRKGRAQAGDDQDCILRLLGHGLLWQQRAPPTRRC